MANIRKTFNFRNGVQVDEDNFIVNPNGLVGIGTSIPSEYLDVRGTAKIVGLVTATDLHISGVATATTIKVGTAITITGGSITATKFLGDGATLSNLPTSQWQDVDVGLGFTSIHAVGNVGVGTTDPRDSFQVGGHPSMTGKRGVGINSLGNIVASGIVTANQFIGPVQGDVIGNVTGIVTGNITGNVTGNVTGNIDGNVNSTGISTFGTISIATLATVGSAATFNSSGLFVTGVTTSTSFVGDITGEVTGDVTGNITGNVTGDLTGDVSAGIVTASTELNVGTGGTALTSLNTGRVGIGTDIPSVDLQIRKEGDASLEIIGESGQTQISIGQSASGGNESALIRYGNPDGSLNIINYNSGSVNSYLHAGGSGISTGRFEWIYGQNNTELLSLTHEGRLGVGKTNPDYNIEVLGTARFSGDTKVGGGLSVTGTLSIGGGIDLPDFVDGTNLYNNAGISTFNNVKVINILETAKIGIGSAIPKAGVGLDAQQTVALFSRIGIATDITNKSLSVEGRTEFAHVGLGTTSSPFFTESSNSSGLHICDTVVGVNKSNIKIGDTSIGMTGNVTVGVGTTSPNCILDCRDAGSVGVVTAGRFILPPVLTTSDISGLTAIAGGIVYNSQTNKLQVYNGSAWVNLN